jgi:hypothetical protein
MVYLSIAYPFYFAIGATKGKQRPIVFEVDTDYLDEYDLHPDEDFVHEAMRMQCKGYPIPSPLEIRDALYSYQHHWQDSLASMGNCCHHGIIPLTAITRYCIFDQTQRMELAMAMMDPSISILNFAICKQKYCGIVEWMFGDRPTLPDDEFSQLNGSPEIRKMLDDRKSFWEQQEQNREGITVCPMPHKA